MHQPVEEITVRRLCSKFGVRSTTELTEEKRQYAGEFVCAAKTSLNTIYADYNVVPSDDRTVF